MAHIAEAAGFGSVRRFNAVIHEVYGCPPTALRKGSHKPGGKLELQIPVEGPMPWDRMLRFLEPWTAPGVEQVVGDRYYRTASFGKAAGEIRVTYEADAQQLNVRVTSSLGANLLDVVSGVRRLFDVDAPTRRIAEHLQRDPELAERLAVSPGLRVPGAFDHFETAVMMLVNQHMSPNDANELMDRIVEKYGKRIETSRPSLTHIFPTPYVLSTAKLEAVGVPTRRSRCIQALAKAVREGALRLDGAPSLDAAIQGLRQINDLSAATAHYIAMRVYREPDAFPPNNRWLRQALCRNGTAAISSVELESRAEAWRPWRAYAAMLLWDGYLDGDREAASKERRHALRESEVRGAGQVA